MLLVYLRLDNLKVTISIFYKIQQKGKLQKVNLTYQVPKGTTYQNVKEVLKAEFQMSNRLLLKLKKLQKIYLNHQCVYVHHPILPGDVIICDLNDEEDNTNIVPTSIPLAILYEDEAYLVVNKPAGVPVHPSMEHYEDSLSNGIRFYFDQIGLKKKIRPINRLDKDTSGIVLFAKNEYIQECLAKQMKSNKFMKKYIAIVNGRLEQKSGTINLPIDRKENSIIERCISQNGKTAITHYKVITLESLFQNYFSFQNMYPHKQRLNNCNNFSDFDIVECTLETGRTHQIRVHFASIGHPLLGDTLYGSASPFIARQALHAYKISFVHPITQKLVSYIAPIPEDFYPFMIKNF